ncbi:pyridoxal-dependent decarboxylase conserved domain-containing protein [Ditylenchus destructor]|uniref:Pyridoxal-dependent decarboxylase conserved domain-containing protein n=1 Tax=Ditylenchus destructor TaxID=166010 RepID=A0AAD4QWN9_9BILA|nr:pyridoxal-dependent decarboxylase conserved domain-containing protein [Ditylenchus destructor]
MPDIVRRDFLLHNGLLFILCSGIVSATKLVHQCKCPQQSSALFPIILPWSIVALLVAFIYFQQNSDSMVGFGELMSKRKNLTHILDTSKNSAIADAEINLPIKADQFRGYMQIATEFAIEYLNNTEAYSVTNDLKPGFLYKKIKKRMPAEADPFSVILNDIYDLILPGMTHWQHPRFHGYFPAGCSYPDIIAETIISSLAVVQFSWDSSPVFTELEVAMVNWLGRAIGLDESFLFLGNAERSIGGGALQPSSSDAVLIALLAARHRKLCAMVPKSDPNFRLKRAAILGKLVAYASGEAHTCIEKACELAMVRLRTIPTCSKKFNMRGEALEHEILKDLERGFIPFFIHATAGTTSLCAFDDLCEITAIAKKYSMWAHVDAAYAGGAMVCPEFRHLIKGVQYADSINMNMHKFMLVSTTCAILWTKDQAAIRATYEIEPVYLKKHHEEATDFRHWGISLSRRTKSLKMWILFRMYGLQNIQVYIRRLVGHALHFRDYLKDDQRIEIVGETHLGLVCFRVKATDLQTANQKTIDLCEYINRSHRMLVTHAAPRQMDVIRVCMCQERLREIDVDKSWTILKELIDEFFNRGFDIPAKRTQFKVDGQFQVSPCPTVESTISTMADTLLSVRSVSSRRSPAISPADGGENGKPRN